MLAGKSMTSTLMTMRILSEFQMWFVRLTGIYALFWPYGFSFGTPIDKLSAFEKYFVGFVGNEWNNLLKMLILLGDISDMCVRILQRNSLVASRIKLCNSWIIWLSCNQEGDSILGEIAAILRLLQFLGGLGYHRELVITSGTNSVSHIWNHHNSDRWGIHPF